MTSAGQSIPQAYPSIDALTGMRFLAAAMIVEGHSWALWQPSFLIGLKLNQGVSVFFVLSGFILAYVYPTAEDVWAKKFFKARFARIWPLHMASTALLFLLVPGIIDQFFLPGGFLTAVQYLTLTHAWIPTWQNFLAYNGVSWTLSVEALFYLSFPLWIMNWRQLNWLKLPAAYLPVFVLISATNLYPLPNEPWTPGLTMNGVLHHFPLARLPEFVSGVLVAQLWIKYRPRWTFATSAVMEIAALILTYWALAQVWPIAHGSISKSLLGEGGSIWLLENGFTPVFVFLIFVFASSTGPVARLLSLKPIVILGEISFATYLLHTVVLRYFQRFPETVLQNSTLWRIIYWAGVIGLSYLAFEFLERPAKELIRGGKELWKPSIKNPLSRRIIIFASVTASILALLIGWA